MKVKSICLGRLATNCYLIEIDRVRIIIDPAEPSEELFSFIGEQKIDLVVNTHGHFDHVGGNWILQDAGAQVLLHRADLPLVDRYYPNHPAIDRYLEEGDLIAGELRVIHTPGHSPGSVILAADGVLFVGDLLFAGSIGRTDFPGGSLEEMKRSLKKLLSLPGDYQIYPGHGEATTLEQERQTNPFLLSWR